MPLPEPPIEMEFRDGIHVVPVHVASNINISGLDPIRFTYREAIELSNDAILKNFVNRYQEDLIFAHFRNNR